VARQRQLARPPIKEALIDLQLEQQMPEQFAEQIGAISLPEFPKKSPVRFQQFQIQLAEMQTSTTNELFGWRFESADGSKIIQFRRNGMGFSIVRGYQNWNHIKSLAQQFWTLYTERAGPLIVNRLATRYINVIEVPISGLRFDDYLSASPRLPEGLPQGIQHFLQRLTVPFKSDVSAIIIQTLDTPTATHIPLILDIDVQMQRRAQGDSPDIWGGLDTLRGIKNDIFFSSVTERALEPYE
jgi:uncharacterized protein (TIGR04255 family)